jgi:glycosyltransferase involved in cell wall biosynthesis
MIAREAIAYGRPVVAAAVGGLADLTEGVLMTEPRDSAALRRNVEQLFADRFLRSRLGREGRAYAQSELSVDVTSAALRAAYSAALGGKSST